MKANIDQIKEKVLPILKTEGVLKAALFGSYVRGEEGIDSDIDMLVEVPKGTGLFAFVDLRHKLQEALGKKVDLVTYRSIHPLLREKVLKEQISLI